MNDKEFMKKEYNEDDTVTVNAVELKNVLVQSQANKDLAGEQKEHYEDKIKALMTRVDDLEEINESLVPLREITCVTKKLEDAQDTIKGLQDIVRILKDKEKQDILDKPPYVTLGDLIDKTA